MGLQTLIDYIQSALPYFLKLIHVPQMHTEGKLTILMSLMGAYVQGTTCIAKCGVA